MISTRMCFAIVFCAVPALLQAATLVEQRDANSHTVTYMEGARLRVSSAGEDGYLLMDFDGGTMYIVSPEAGTVIDNSAAMRELKSEQATSAGAAPRTRYEHLGAGPVIAGYQTERYAEYANDVYCGEMFMSRQAMEDAGVDKFMDAMAAGSFSESGVESDLCDWDTVAEMEFLRENGFPLRTVGAAGELEDEVLSIQTDVALPPGGFDPPSGYRMISMQDMVSGAMGGMAMPGMGDDAMDGEDADWEEDLDAEQQEALRQLQEAYEAMKKHGGDN